MLNVETEVKPEDILKLKGQERTLFDDYSDEITDDEDDEHDKETELTNPGDEQAQTDDKGNNSNTGNKETDDGGGTKLEQKIKTMKKPKRAEYKVIR